MFFAIDFKWIILLIVLVIGIVVFLVVFSYKQYQKVHERMINLSSVDPELKTLESLSKEQKDMFGLIRNENEENPNVTVHFDDKDVEKIDNSKDLFTYNPEVMPAFFDAKAPDKANPIEFEPEDEYVQLSTGEVEGLPKIRYRKGIMAKLVLAPEEVKENYTSIKNTLLSFRDVTAKMTFSEENFYENDRLVARINTRGSYLYLYLALNPADAMNDNYNIIDVSNEKKYQEVPTLIKIKNQKNFNYGLKLINDMKLTYYRSVNDSYDLTPLDDWELLRRGLIK